MAESDLSMPIVLSAAPSVDFSLSGIDSSCGSDGSGAVATSQLRHLPYQMHHVPVSFLGGSGAEIEVLSSWSSVSLTRLPQGIPMLSNSFRILSIINMIFFSLRNAINAEHCHAHLVPQRAFCGAALSHNGPLSCALRVCLYLWVSIAACCARSADSPPLPPAPLCVA